MVWTLKKKLRNYRKIKYEWIWNCRHIGENAELVVVKEAGHAINAEKPKEMYKHIKAFLTTHPNLSPSTNSSLCSF